MQPKSEIDDHYKNPDPWGYQKSEDDYRRSEKICNMARRYAPAVGLFTRALDVGCGEGWITQRLPAMNIHGYEISDNAASRFPVNVSRIVSPSMKYDLVVSTGTLYPHYDWESMTDIISRCASRIVLLSYIAAWEFKPALERIPGKQVELLEFEYGEFTQRMRVFDLTA
jgi:hypothetical protein